MTGAGSSRINRQAASSLDRAVQMARRGWGVPEPALSVVVIRIPLFRIFDSDLKMRGITSVARDQGHALGHGMGADQEISEHPWSVATARAILAKRLTREVGRFPR